MMQNIFGFPNPDIDNNVEQNPNIDRNEAAVSDSTSVFYQGGHRNGPICKR